MKLLDKGFKHNLHFRHKDWIKTLAVEADTAISKINEREGKYGTSSSIQRPKTHKQTKDTK
jgi:hypothetical protein